MSGRHREDSNAAAPRSPQTHVQVHEPGRIEDFLPGSDWEVFRKVIALATARGLDFAVSGGVATSFYTAVWRFTKDLDLCVLPRDRDAMVEATVAAGLHDLYDEKPYDRGWIYRATTSGVIVDIIWRLANYRGDVDETWLVSGPAVTVHGDTLRLVPPEEMIWSKIFVVQRERCDLPDILNILYACGAQLDWTRLLRRLDGEEHLLAAVLSLYCWLAPGRARGIPEWVWPRLGLRRPASGPERDDERIRCVDSRPWFTPV